MALIWKKGLFLTYFSHFLVETWTVTKKIGKALDGWYTRVLRAALDISWKSHITNRELYGDLPKITAKITNRRLRFAGHCKRRKGSVVSNLITWQPTQRKRTAGRPTKTYVDQLQADTGYTTGEMESCMENRNLWRAIIGVRQITPEWVRVREKLQNFLQHISHSHTYMYFAHPIDFCCLTNLKKNTNLSGMVSLWYESWYWFLFAPVWNNQ